MNKVYIGKIVNTHGIKGEIRLLSDFPFKDKVFVVGNNILVDDIEHKINSHRRHKMFDMITLDGYNNINDVLFLVKKKVYFDKDKIHHYSYVLNNNFITNDLFEKCNQVIEKVMNKISDQSNIDVKKIRFGIDEYFYNNFNKTYYENYKVTERRIDFNQLRKF